MVGIIRKVLIFAATDGVVLQPLDLRKHNSAGAVKIAYQTHDISPFVSDGQGEGGGESQQAAIEAHGIAGRNS
jgi:hypothetical protein